MLAGHIARVFVCGFMARLPEIFLNYSNFLTFVILLNCYRKVKGLHINPLSHNFNVLNKISHNYKERDNLA